MALFKKFDVVKIKKGHLSLPDTSGRKRHFRIGIVAFSCQSWLGGLKVRCLVIPRHQKLCCIVNGGCDCCDNRVTNCGLYYLESSLDKIQ